MIEVFDCEQNSPEWYALRAGIPTASEFSTILAKGKNGSESLTRRKYLYQIAGEIVTGEPTEGFTNPWLERGRAMEVEACNYYSFMHDEPIERGGFVRNGRKGWSPDRVIGTSGALEVKTARSDILIGLLLKNEFPPEHMAQCQGGLWVGQREWIDLCIYWPKLPLFVKRVYRNEDYIRTLTAAIDAFNEDVDRIVVRLRSYDRALAA